MFQILKTPGHRVLIKPDPVREKRTTSGLIIADIDGQRARQAAGVTGTVVEVGDTCWKEFGGDPWCRVGDRVLYAKYAGVSVEDNQGEQAYVLLNDEDILAVISGEE
jgi:co-chaperonin GroES (HSP10)